MCIIYTVAIKRSPDFFFRESGIQNPSGRSTNSYNRYSSGQSAIEATVAVALVSSILHASASKEFQKRSPSRILIRHTPEGSFPFDKVYHGQLIRLHCMNILLQKWRVYLSTRIAFYHPSIQNYFSYPVRLGFELDKGFVCVYGYYIGINRC